MNAAAYESWIGREDESRERILPHAVQAMAATLDLERKKRMANAGIKGVIEGDVAIVDMPMHGVEPMREAAE